MWWHAYWFLIKGEPEWRIIWVDGTMAKGARAKLEAKLGRLDGFEEVEGVQPLHVKEIMQGAQFHIKLPERKRGDRRRKVEAAVAVQ
jgi:hypothetical protein